MGVISVQNLTSLDQRVTDFVIECYSDSGLTTLVDTQTMPAVWDITNAQAKMVGAVRFRTLTAGTTYYLRSATIVPGYGPSAWSSTYSIAAGDDPTSVASGSNSGFSAGSGSSGLWVQDPTGYIRQWGVIATDINGGTVAVTFPTPFATGSAAASKISVIVTTKSSADRITFVVDGSVTDTGFTVSNNGSSGFAYWEASGPGAPSTGIILTGNPMTTAGDLIVGGAAGAPGRLAAGTSGYLLTSNGPGAAPSWQAPTSGMINPMTAAGDIIIGGTAGAATRLAKDTDGKVLTLASGAPAWQSPSGGGGGGTGGNGVISYTPPVLTDFAWVNQGTATDGLNWIPFYSVSNTDFITPDQVGFYVNAAGNGTPVSMSLLSYQEM